jgi:hypothetical protein
VNALRPFWLALLCGIVPIAATHGAQLLNLFSAGETLLATYRCMPYSEGCVSISRAVRSGAGLHLFQALMLPTAALLALMWICIPPWLKGLVPGSVIRARNIAASGVIGALFLILYVAALGTEGSWYSWMRRYGVVMYFGLTALAQLLLVRALWPLLSQPLTRPLDGPLRALFALVCMEWLGGVLSVAKRVLLTDPDLIDRVENIIEWWFALALSAAFVALAELMRRSHYRLDARVGQVTSERTANARDQY